VTDLGNGRYRVQGWVDAQNSFGAMIRSNFVVELETSDGETWQCTSIAIK